MTSLTSSLVQADLDHAPAAVRERVQAFRLLIVLGTQLRALMDRRLSSSDITTQQAALLALASAAKTPPTQGELAAQLGVSHQNVRQLADALERKGFLEVRADPNDRRTRRMVPTKAVETMFARRNPKDFEAVSGWFSTLDDEEIAVLVSLLARLAESVSEERSRPADL
jgi:DNA-binding MarR family transcriptional regulator